MKTYHLSKQTLEKVFKEDQELARRLEFYLDIFDAFTDMYESTDAMLAVADTPEEIVIFAEECLSILQERKEIANKIQSVEREILFKYGDFQKIDKATIQVDSPVAEVSRLLSENFEASNAFGTVNSKEIVNIIGRKLSTNNLHKAVLNNFPGIKFRKQNGGFTYTLKRRDTTNLND